MNPLVRQVIGSSLLRKLVCRLFGNYVTVFTLHRTTPASAAFEGTTPALLDECLAHAKAQGFHFLSIDEVVDKALAGLPLPGPTLCFTIDDGYADQIHELVPVLLRYQAKPTLFVISNLVDQLDWPWDAKLAYMVWNSTVELKRFVFGESFIDVDFTTPAARKHSRRRLTRFGKTLSRQALDDFMVAAAQQFGVTAPQTPPELYRPLDWASLREYEKKGLRVGSHGQSHYIFNALSEAEISAELHHANLRLAAEIATPSNVFCYPSGTAQDFCPQHEPLVAAAGFNAAVSTISQCTTLRNIKAAPFRIERIGFPQNIDTFVRYSSWFEFLRSKVAG